MLNRNAGLSELALAEGYPAWIGYGVSGVSFPPDRRSAAMDPRRQAGIEILR